MSSVNSVMLGLLEVSPPGGVDLALDEVQPTTPFLQAFVSAAARDLVENRGSPVRLFFTDLTDPPGGPDPEGSRLHGLLIATRDAARAHFPRLFDNGRPEAVMVVGRVDETLREVVTVTHASHPGWFGVWDFGSVCGDLVSPCPVFLACLVANLRHRQNRMTW